MTRYDRWGLEVATDHPDAIAGLDSFDTSILTYGTTAAAAWEAAQQDPACVMAAAKGAALELLLQTGASVARARERLAAVAPHLATTTPRERRWHALVAAWADENTDTAIACGEEIAGRWPEDLVAMKLTQLQMFHVGDHAGMLRIADTVLPAHRMVAEAHGMRAFALEELDRLDEAEAAARHAISLKRAEPWAQHAVAHVLETRGQCMAGFEFMTAHADTWADRNSFMLGHNWWHTALFAIDTDRADEALAIFDRHVWGIVPDYSQDQVNAVALLARLDFAGLDVGARWQDVGGFIARRGPEHVEPFLDAHYLLGLTRAGLETAAADLLASLRDHVARQPDMAAGRIWRNTGLPLAEGVAAYGRGDWAIAFERLGTALPGLQQIGGSHAQRDLFVQLWLRAGARAGEHAVIRPYLQRRAAERPGVAKHRRELDSLSPA